MDSLQVNVIVTLEPDLRSEDISTLFADIMIFLFVWVCCGYLFCWTVYECVLTCVCVVCGWCVVRERGKNVVRMCRQKDMKKAAKRHQKRVGCVMRMLQQSARKKKHQLTTVP